MTSMLFPALLKYWRGRRGLSQLDFSVRAGVSSKHISFLETGRSTPSEEMVISIAAALALSGRQRDELLMAAGFEGAIDDTPALEVEGVRSIVEQMFEAHEPFPMMVLDGAYDVLAANAAGQKLMNLAFPSLGGRKINAILTVFDPKGLRPRIRNWEEMAKELINRLHRESLMAPHDGRLKELIQQALAFPGIPKEWERPNFSKAASPLLAGTFALGPLEVSFLTTVTRFSAPQVTELDELQIEAWFPQDESTRQFCMNMLAAN